MSPGEDGLPPEAGGTAPGRGRLAGRRILVVGGGQVRSQSPGLTGNGRAISVLCAREGASVVVADINQDAAEETARLIRSAGGDAEVVVADASSEDAVREMFEAAGSARPLDGLVAVVGAARPGDFDTTSVEDWDWTFRTNVRSHFLAVREALARMARGSSIVLISSIAAAAPVHGIVAYHSSKAALEGIKTVAARRGGPLGVRVNVVAAGTIATPTAEIGAARNPEYRETVAAAAERIPLGRRGTAWEVAYATVFLLSDEASFITGHTLYVDGGYVALRG